MRELEITAKCQSKPKSGICPREQASGKWIKMNLHSTPKIIEEKEKGGRNHKEGRYVSRHQDAYKNGYWQAGTGMTRTNTKLEDTLEENIPACKLLIPHWG